MLNRRKLERDNVQLCFLSIYNSRLHWWPYLWRNPGQWWRPKWLWQCICVLIFSVFHPHCSLYFHKFIYRSYSGRFCRSWGDRMRSVDWEAFGGFLACVVGVWPWWNGFHRYFTARSFTGNTGTTLGHQRCNSGWITRNINRYEIVRHAGVQLQRLPFLRGSLRTCKNCI
jgi:hypothetical protein